MLTHNGTYKWFYMEDEFIACLTESEKDEVYIDYKKDGISRIFYPAKAWEGYKCEVSHTKMPLKIPIPMDKYKKELKAAISIMDFDEIENIKQRIRDEQTT